jgi:hypothetical protein
LLAAMNFHWFCNTQGTDVTPEDWASKYHYTECAVTDTDIEATMSMEWKHFSDLRPPTGLLVILQWYMSMEIHGGMILTGKNRRTRRETCPSDTWGCQSTTHHTRTDPNPQTRCLDGGQSGFVRTSRQMTV